jgi:hypothetical protein
MSLAVIHLVECGAMDRGQQLPARAEALTTVSSRASKRRRGARIPMGE